MISATHVDHIVNIFSKAEDLGYHVKEINL